MDAGLEPAPDGGNGLMATGPEHYREAERLIGMSWENDRDYDNIAALVDRAQVHATLALAAATALNSTGVGEADLGEWTALICEPDDVPKSCPCGCSGSPDQCTCGMRCVCSDCAYCDAILRGVAIPAQRDGELADWEHELLANSVEPTPEQEAANAAELALAKAHQHDMASCPECVEQYEAEQAEDREHDGPVPETVNPHLTYGQLNGTACTACGLSFAVGEKSVPVGTQAGYQLFVHRDCPESEAAR